MSEHFDRQFEAEQLMPGITVQVRNLTQAEIDKGLGPLDRAKLEQEFFNSHAELRDLPEKYLGIEALVKKLVKVQEECVLGKFPALKEQV